MPKTDPWDEVEPQVRQRMYAFSLQESSVENVEHKELARLRRNYGAIPEQETRRTPETPAETLKRIRGIWDRAKRRRNAA